MDSKGCFRAVLAGGLAALVLGPTARAAHQVRGQITRTYTIVEGTDLSGDVVCDLADNTPCFAFGASGVELRLNGFTITGKADAATGCAGVLNTGENGVSTNGLRNVGVRGPGSFAMDRALRGRCGGI